MKMQLFSLEGDDYERVFKQGKPVDPSTLKPAVVLASAEVVDYAITYWFSNVAGERTYVWFEVAPGTAFGGPFTPEVGHLFFALLEKHLTDSKRSVKIDQDHVVFSAKD